MNVYAVMLNDSNRDVRVRLEQKYGPDNIYLIGNAFLVRTTELAEGVAIAAGIKGEDRFATGVVFKLNRAYAGFTARSLWDWLGQAEQ